MVAEQEYDMESLCEEAGVVIFLMATHGEGEPTDNAVAFHAWLSSGKRAAAEMAAVRFAAFALGNKQYDKFCSMGIWVDERMGALGASRLHALGLGDDDDDLDADFEKWRAGLWAALGCLDADSAGLQPAPFVASFLEGGADAEEEEERPSDEEDDWAADWIGGAALGQGCEGLLPLHSWVAQVYPKLCATPVAVLANRELQAAGAHAKAASAQAAAGAQAEVASTQPLAQTDSTRHIELALTPPSPPELKEWLGAGRGALAASALRTARPLRYATADDAGVYAQNGRQAVELAARLLGVRRSVVFHLAPDAESTANAGHHPMPFPTPCTVGRVLRWYVDLNGHVDKPFLKVLAQYAKDGAEAEALRELVSEAGAPAYHRWALDGRRSVLDALAAAPSARMPWAKFIQMAPRLQPRYYTVSSCPLAAPHALHLTVKVVAERPARCAPPRPLRDRAPEDGFGGVCSNYLAATRPSGSGDAGSTGGANGYAHARTGAADLVLAFVKPSVFRLPARAECPIVMVGPGTGLAPFRAFLQELGERREALPSAALLYFGCQHPAKDFLYEQELRWAVGDAPLGPASDGRAGWEALRPSDCARASAPLSRLRVAFSRLEPAGGKVYVQDCLRADMGMLWPLIAAEGAHVYVCGGTAMGRAVTDTLAEIARAEVGTPCAHARMQERARARHTHRQPGIAPKRPASQRRAAAAAHTAPRSPAWSRCMSRAAQAEARAPFLRTSAVRAPTQLST
jgi:NADPH-ferrihemoprotein reductase